MKIKIFGVPFDLVSFCLINGAIQLCESVYIIVIYFMNAVKSDHITSNDTCYILLFVFLTLSGASLMYGGKKVS